MIYKGVFDRFPKLNMILGHMGELLPYNLQRLDRYYLPQAWFRDDSMPPPKRNIQRKPSEYIRDHIWWTTQPMEDPERREHLFQMIEWVGWDKLLFATDYPHWDFDDPSRVLPAGVSEENKQAFYLDNARRVYGVTA